MTSKLYELRAYKGSEQVRDTHRLVEALDLGDAAGTKDLLVRHLLAVAERDGSPRDRVHLYHLDVHETRDGRPERQVLFTFAVPVEGR